MNADPTNATDTGLSLVGCFCSNSGLSANSPCLKCLNSNISQDMINSDCSGSDPNTVVYDLLMEFPLLDHLVNSPDNTTGIITNSDAKTTSEKSSQNSLTLSSISIHSHLIGLILTGSIFYFL